ncbi:MAG: alpha/beta hydrolase [Gemmatimonadota bacterium]
MKWSATGMVALCGWLALGQPAEAQTLSTCSDARLGEDARCGTMAVREDRSRPDGRMIDLNMVLLPASGASRAEPLFLLAGGPGQAATDLAGLALGPFAPLRQTRDIVLVDQRGTGGSNPLDCPSGSAEDPRKSFGALFRPAELAACAKRLSAHADLTLYRTDEVVADLDEVREALGYERVVLWGGSGGTRTALVWARSFPDRVAAMVLDGVAPTDFTAPSPYAPGVQRSWERVVEDCAAQPACAAAFPDLPGDLDRVLARFDAGPVSTTVAVDENRAVPVTMTRGDFGYALRGLLYGARTVAYAPALVHGAAQSGDLSTFARLLWQRDVAVNQGVQVGVHFAIFCAEDVPFLTPAADAAAAGTFVGTYLLDQYRAACDAWPSEPVAAAYREPVRVDTPTLLFSGYYDPTTPAEQADHVARSLPNSRHIVVRDQAHGAEFGCGRPAVLAFLTRGSLEGLPEVCGEVGPVTFETEPPAS